ncbi:NB-ARC domain containing protein [Dorcoceras hygrometricum]|uniref:NB-ARC domain containing protein n=1 Tax=Dorcoceras hygrometricum TaxID=472368 RepID=A0A2Z6ZRT9_9LAMI|nr:NB-ARC domain containing protein [Dorcoceras hygrometricum]
MKRRRAGESADGLALMTSSVTSSYSADDLREQSQESAGSLYFQTQEKRRRREAIQSQATVHQQMLFGDSDSKTIRKIQSQATVDPVATQRFPDAVFEYPDARR